MIIANPQKNLAKIKEPSDNINVFQDKINLIFTVNFFVSLKIIDIF